MSELKTVNCGCGGEAEVHIMGHEMTKAQYYINCEKCDTRTWFYDSEAEAVTAWNRAMGERTVKVEWYPGLTTFTDGICECGERVRDDWKYCPGCGARLEWKCEDNLHEN